MTQTDRPSALTWPQRAPHVHARFSLLCQAGCKHVNLRQRHVYRPVICGRLGPCRGGWSSSCACRISFSCASIILNVFIFLGSRNLLLCGNFGLLRSAAIIEAARAAWGSKFLRIVAHSSCHVHLAAATSRLAPKSVNISRNSLRFAWRNCQVCCSHLPI